MGGKAELTVLGVAQEDPCGPETQATHQAVEGVVEDRRYVLLSMEAGRDVGENRELSPTGLHLQLQLGDVRRTSRGGS
jgi:hypothetical protein